MNYLKIQRFLGGLLSVVFIGLSLQPGIASTNGTLPNGFLSGSHYNLNMIGAKNIGDVQSSDGHVMFVQLNGKTKIEMTQSVDGTFAVTDPNGLDGAASFNI